MNSRQSFSPLRSSIPLSLSPSLPLSLSLSLSLSLPLFLHAPSLPLSRSPQARSSSELAAHCTKQSETFLAHQSDGEALGCLETSQALPPVTHAWLSLITVILAAQGSNHTVSAPCEDIATLCSNKQSDEQISRCWTSVEVTKKPSWHGQSCQVQTTTFTDKLRVTCLMCTIITAKLGIYGMMHPYLSSQRYVVSTSSHMNVLDVL